VGFLIGEREFCVVNSVQIGTGTEWDIGLGKGVLCCRKRANWNWNCVGYRNGKRELVLSTVCKLELELSCISDWGKGGLCCQHHAN
jgi:hypothetical protein